MISDTGNLHHLPGGLVRNQPVLRRLQGPQHSLLHDAPLAVALALQQDLDTLGIDGPVGPLDGFVGPEPDAAVGRVQHLDPLVADALQNVGPELVCALARPVVATDYIEPFHARQPDVARDQVEVPLDILVAGRCNDRFPPLACNLFRYGSTGSADFQEG